MVDLADLTDVTSLVVGDAFSCALRGDGGVACWGSNDRKQLAQDTVENTFSPMMVALPSETVQLVSGADFACALGADAIARCWGANDMAQLGRGGALEDSLDPAGVRW